MNNIYVQYPAKWVQLRKVKKPFTYSPEFIGGMVSSYFDIPMEQLKKMSRVRKFVYARHIAFYLIRAYTNCSLQEVARVFGRDDHTTVLHGVNTIKFHIRLYPDVAQDVKQLSLLIKQ